MYYVLIALAAVVVVMLASILLEAKVQFRRRSRANSQAVTRLPRARLPKAPEIPVPGCPWCVSPAAVLAS
jgi:hypothetical protein